MKCRRCKAQAQVALPSHHTGFCAPCFETYFLRQVERGIHEHRQFTREDSVLLAVSGGKDSLGLLLALKELGFKVTALHIDLAIPVSSESARSTVEAYCAAHGVELRVIETARDGLAIPDVKARVKRPICSVCGKIKRHWFNRYAYEQGFDVLATGHNLDDEVARLFANTLRWDQAYLAGQGPVNEASGRFVRKVKPLCRLTEYETAVWCFLKGIEHVLAPCPYSGGASFTGHKRLLADLEERSPGMKMQFYEHFLRSGRPAFKAQAQDAPPLNACTGCGYPTSQDVCGVCRIRERLEA
ncbi:tRNA 2-thiocytidine biosynthesis protein TtcA [Fundidesulfovibrio magnetotacticus]|uniref:tRNA 2-thiocytidine biosynthesis protein TtcA n=1 Tax=Fundidesulfovibrio magnetotacticus TaxID=2730080 RepID=A0A6V8LW48_9BACT|nr:ATP-binding protein [Fundidesulfovibrio magnetotacticus]GFK94036.1 tRNA 2-thiocytidine biosynthesis protein TtcA [Fundidesulfovibrio magnetotacticus]